MKKPNPKKHVRCLERRLKHLESRVSTSSKDLSYDKAEIAALRWAISLAQTLYPETAQVTVTPESEPTFEVEGHA